MRALCLPVMGLLAMALLAGCGQKGPLYFAPQPAAKQPTQQQPAKPGQQQKQGTDHHNQNADGN